MNNNVDGVQTENYTTEEFTESTLILLRAIKISGPKFKQQDKAIEKQIELPEVQQNANFQIVKKPVLPQ